MTFSEALEGVKRGERWNRSGWNGKGMCVYLIPNSVYLSFMVLLTAAGQVVPWTASQTDLLTDDWYPCA